MSLDYVKLATQSLKNAWEHKFLWLFGLFVAGSDFSGIFNLLGRVPSDRDFSRRWNFDFHDFRDIEDIMPFGIDLKVILMLIAAAFLLWLFFLIMGFLSEGALIQGISRKQLGQPVSFGECWSKGVDRFWRVLVILVLIGLAMVIPIVFVVLLLIPAFIASPVLGVVLLLLIVLPVIFAVIFVCESISAWGIRFAVLDDVQCFDAIGKGWQMLRENFGKTFGVALTTTIVQIVYGIACLVGILIVSIPFILIGLGSPIGAIVMGAPFLLIIIVVISAYIGLFKSSIWTIAYMQITEKAESTIPAIADTGAISGGLADSDSPA
jgi:hypothetical protein